MTTATTPTVDLEKFEGWSNKKANVTFRRADSTEVETLEVVIQAIADKVGIVFREKGKQGITIIPPSDIFGIEPISTPARKVKQKALKEPTLDDIRSHLADRHATPLTWVNSNTPQACMEFHSTIDHTGLGHMHGELPATETAAKAGDSESSATNGVPSEY